MGTIASIKASMGYSMGKTAESCRYCNHATKPTARELRCGKGAFYVQPRGGCREFVVGADKLSPVQASGLDTADGHSPRPALPAGGYSSDR